ncbi:Trk K+ transport system NAD-binding subunit [Streptomyces africanus]|uniref:Trk K+ transport system NAD-binding subunit n=1 Tax=Streptomyces africanus TaxID=231024 RepID=A0ABU0QHD3_9ACTN|nr:TrkA C-terminal domain-containing protein [Streptomyces africanus]MDQ0745902.1 Trk K+ transport system NAD-binding subunit [Streptomyces africanus]
MRAPVTVAAAPTDMSATPREEGQGHQPPARPDPRALGLHHVVLPEREMGERVAHPVTGRMLNFIEFDDDYALVKTVAPDIATGMPLGQSQVRSRYGVTVVGIKRPGAGFTYAAAETVVQKGDVIVVTGKTRAVEAFAELT